MPMPPLSQESEPKLRIADRMLRRGGSGSRLGRPSRLSPTSVTAIEDDRDEQLDRLAALERVHVERMESLERTQTAVIETLAELSSAVRLLRDAVGDDKILLARQNNEEAAAPVTELEEEEEDDLDRKQVRLDGLEVYAVVSAVTAGTLVAVFDGYQPGDVVDLFHDGRYLEVLMSLAFLIIGSIGIVCGLHCIFVFSLITMYGRTALGMERDDALETFFAGTGMQRYRGFQSFVRSLYALMGELIVVIAAKVSSRPSIHLVGLCATMTLMYYVYRDTQVIMDKAGVIFAPRPVPTPATVQFQEEEEEEKDGGKNEGRRADATASVPHRPTFTKGSSSLNLAATDLLDDDEGKTKPTQSVFRNRRARSSWNSFNESDDELMEEETEEPPSPNLRQRSAVRSLQTQPQVKKTAHASRGGRPGMMKRASRSSLTLGAVELLDEEE